MFYKTSEAKTKFGCLLIGDVFYILIITQLTTEELGYLMRSVLCSSKGNTKNLTLSGYQIIAFIQPILELVDLAMIETPAEEISAEYI